MINAILISLSLLTLGPTSDDANKADLKSIKKVVHQFSEAADQRDLKKIEAVLHPQFRSVVNRLFGSTDLSVMDRTVYLQLLEAEKIGGDQRKVSITSIDINRNNAVVKAVMIGKELRFDTHLQLVKDAAGKWWIVSDMPSIEKLK